MAVFLDEDGYVDQRVCRFYLVSKCLSGNRCSFLHCKELLKTKMTWVCLHYLSSAGCSFGANCRFDHPSWASGLYLLPKICGQYRHEKDGEQCADQNCRYYHFTEEEHQAYIKDQVIPERYRHRKKKGNSYIVNYSSDDEDQAKGEGRPRDNFQRGRPHHDARQRGRSRSPKRPRSKSPARRGRSRSPLRSSSRPKRNDSPETDDKRVQGMKRTLKDLRSELDEVCKENRHLKRQVADHKRFHDSDQELINDLMRARDKLEDDVSKFNLEKLDLTKQINDLFSDNKVVVEENQRLRNLLQQAQDGRLPSASQSMTPLPQGTYPDSFTITNTPPASFQTSWN